MRRVLALVLTLAAAPLWAQTPAIDALVQAAEGGDDTAQRALARRFEAGDGVVQNYAEAARWYAEAARAGSAEAANRLGILAHAGLGVPRDVTRAVALLEQAARDGTPRHLHDLALVLETEMPDGDALARAAQLYARASDAGYTDASVSLAVLYQEGRGVPQDFERAIALYETAAEAGHARALNNLGLLYVRGQGVAQDYARAADLISAAAEQGLPQALTNLATLYENGFGVPQSDSLAARYYRLGGQGATVGSGIEAPLWDSRLAPPPEDAATLDAAVAAGDPVAEYLRAFALLSGRDPSPRDAIGAARLFRRAAEAGHSVSMANLALLYFEGRGVPQDFVLGQMWLSLAGTAGFPAAPALAAEWTPRLTPAQINEAQSLASATWQESTGR